MRFLDSQPSRLFLFRNFILGLNSITILRYTRLAVSLHFEAMFMGSTPDGRWLAYVSDESGLNEIYAQAYPAPGGKSQIWTEGGPLPTQWQAQ
jgi:hypothetical protein